MVGYAGHRGGRARARDDARQRSRRPRTAHVATIDILFEGTDAITDLMATARNVDRRAAGPRNARADDGHPNGAADAAVNRSACEPQRRRRRRSTSSRSRSTAASAPIARRPRTRRHGGDMVRVSADKIDRLIALRGELLREFTSKNTSSKSLLPRRDSAFDDVEALRTRIGRRRGSGARAASAKAAPPARDQLARALSRIAERNVRRTALLEESARQSCRPAHAARRHDPAAAMRGSSATSRCIKAKKPSSHVAGGDVALDKVVLDALKEPLIHLVRNAVAHGLESPAVRCPRGKRRWER